MHDCSKIIAKGLMETGELIFREGNKCVDHLANLVQSKELGSMIVDTPLASLLPLLQTDA
ncbi:hypothetical protein J1N35_034886, partial [Gossypium stocksii]